MARDLAAGITSAALLVAVAVSCGMLDAVGRRPEGTMDRFERALQTATERLIDEFGAELVGILFAGSAAYGTPMRSSDVDLFVLIGPSWRQRRNELVDGVEVEMFINPVEQIRREIADTLTATVDMFARGRICHDPTGVVAELVADARTVAAGPAVPPTEGELYFIRYFPSDLLRDAEDLVEVDEVAAELVLGEAVRRAIEAHWSIRGLAPPKLKRAMATLREESPDVAALATSVLRGELPLAHRVARLRHLCDTVLEPVGGILLEGCTPREPVP